MKTEEIDFLIYSLAVRCLSVHPPQGGGEDRQAIIIANYVSNSARRLRSQLASQAIRSDNVQRWWNLADLCNGRVLSRYKDWIFFGTVWDELCLLCTCLFAMSFSLDDWEVKWSNSSHLIVNRDLMSSQTIKKYSMYEVTTKSNISTISSSLVSRSGMNRTMEAVFQQYSEAYLLSKGLSPQWEQCIRQLRMGQPLNTDILVHVFLRQTARKATSMTLLKYSSLSLLASWRNCYTPPTARRPSPLHRNTGGFRLGRQNLSTRDTRARVMREKLHDVGPVTEEMMKIYIRM